MEITGIDHIVLRTTKLSAMLNFYCKVLGCSIARETPPETGLIQLRAGNALIDLVTVEGELGKMGGGAPSKSEKNLDHFCLQLKPISETDLTEYLLSHHIEVGKFEERYGAHGFGPSIYIKDPEDNTVELKSQV